MYINAQEDQLEKSFHHQVVKHSIPLFSSSHLYIIRNQSTTTTTTTTTIHTTRFSINRIANKMYDYQLPSASTNT